MLFLFLTYVPPSHDILFSCHAFTFCSVGRKLCPIVLFRCQASAGVCSTFRISFATVRAQFTLDPHSTKAIRSSIRIESFSSCLVSSHCPMASYHPLQESSLTRAYTVACGCRQANLIAILCTRWLPFQLSIISKALQYVYSNHSIYSARGPPCQCKRSTNHLSCQATFLTENEPHVASAPLHIRPSSSIEGDASDHDFEAPVASWL